MRLDNFGQEHDMVLQSVLCMINSVLFGAVLELLVNAIHFDLSKFILRSLLENQLLSTAISDSLFCHVDSQLELDSIIAVSSAYE